MTECMANAGYRRLLTAVVVIVVLLAGWRVWLASQAELLPEEAYYWTYAQHPALSYFDHPPLTSWLIRAGTACLGHNELGVRAGLILLSLASCGLVWLLARWWFGGVAALWAVLMFSLLPIYVGAGLLAFPDGPLIFFWLLALYALTRAMDVRSLEDGGREAMAAAGVGSGTGWWLLAGVALGGAMLSKYTAALLGPGFLLYLFLFPPHRFWLRRPQPWLAVVVAAVIFAPVILWNAQHQWASFAFQSGRTDEAGGPVLHNVGVFWAGQLLVLTPLVLGLLAVTLARGLTRGWRGRDPAWAMALACSAPGLLLFIYASFKTDVHINWMAPVWLSLLPAGGSLLARGCQQAAAGAARRWWVGVIVALVVCGVAVVGSTGLLMSWLPPAISYSRAGGWRALAREVADARETLRQETGQEPFVIGHDRYYLASALGFYLDDPANVVNRYALGDHGLGYRYWTDLPAWAGRPAVIVITREKAATVAELANHFERVGVPVTVRLPRACKELRKITLVSGYGYRPPSVAEQLGAPVKAKQRRSTAP